MAGAGSLPGEPGLERFDGLVSRIQRPVYDAALWTLPFTVIGFSRLQFTAIAAGGVIVRTQIAQNEFRLYLRGGVTGALWQLQDDNLGATFDKESPLVIDGLWHLTMAVILSPAANTSVHLLHDNINDGFDTGGNPPLDTGTIPLMLGARFLTAALNTYGGLFDGDQCMIAVLPGIAGNLALCIELYALAGGGTAVVPGIIPQGMVFMDNFNGAGGTRLNTRAADTVRPTAGLYTEHAGVWTVDGARPFLASATAVAHARVTIDVGQTPSIVRARIGSAAGDFLGAVCGRVVDGNNFWMVQIDSGLNAVTLWDCTGGMYTQHDLAALVMAAGSYYEVDIRFDGNAITGWVDDVQYVAFNSALHAGGERVGVESDNNANTRIDWLEAWE